MSRTLTATMPADVTGTPVYEEQGAPPFRLLLQRLVPLWRYAVWGAALFAVLAASAVIRLDVQQVRNDLARHDRAERESSILNDRLRLEVDARRRTLAMEAVATELGLGAEAQVVRLSAP